MTFNPMKTPILASLFVGLALAASPSGFGQTVTSDPAGFVTVSVQANSDAVLGVPLYRTAAFKGVIQSISGNTITVAGTSPGWSTNQFVQSLPGQTNTYAVLLATGTKEGMFAKVTANAANTVTVQFDTGDDFTGVKTEAVDGAGNGDHIDVVAYWTLSTLLASVPDGTEVYDYFNPLTGIPSSGINLSPSTLFVFDLTAGFWKDQITEDDVSHTPLRFGSALLLRNNSAGALSLSFVGSVPMASHRLLLRTLAGQLDQDIRIGYLSPIPETLSTLGIPASTGDQIFAYDNNAAGKNKSPAKILVYSGTGWVDGITEDPEDNYQMQPGNGYVFRKFRTASPSVAVWQDVQSYLTP